MASPVLLLRQSRPGNYGGDFQQAMRFRHFRPGADMIRKSPETHSDAATGNAEIWQARQQDPWTTVLACGHRIVPAATKPAGTPDRPRQRRAVAHRFGRR